VGKPGGTTRLMMACLRSVCEIIYDQKFTLAAAGLLSASFIARDLGLLDKKGV
jgi:hypothetical protein